MRNSAASITDVAQKTPNSHFMPILLMFVQSYRFFVGGQKYFWD